MSEDIQSESDNDRQPDCSEAQRDHMSQEKDDFPCESIISVTLDNIQKHCELSKDLLEQLIKRLSNTSELGKSKTNELEKHLTIVAECQKETAKIASGYLEHYVLHPAIETVAVLTDLIEDLFRQTAALVENHEPCLLFQPILDTIANAARIARAKLDYLDIEKIEPHQFDEYDPNKHDIRQTVPIDESSRHKRIERNLVAGLVYRGKVLRPAKVSVYRYSENQ